MKKVIIFLFVLISVCFINSKERKYVIPNESIRFRIIANSNSPKDQLLKMDVRTQLLPILNNVSKDAKNVKEARENIQNNLSLIEGVLSENVDTYQVNFGNNYFPQKLYKNILYEEGNYESLVITLGEGVGENWWCVLFPPLCLLEAQSSNIEDIKYESYLKKIINKYL